LTPKNFVEEKRRIGFSGWRMTFNEMRGGKKSRELKLKSQVRPKTSHVNKKWKENRK